MWQAALLYMAFCTLKGRFLQNNMPPFAQRKTAYPYIVECQAFVCWLLASVRQHHRHPACGLRPHYEGLSYVGRL